jgi:hypothetical protein
MTVKIDGTEPNVFPAVEGVDGQPSILKRDKFPFLLVGHWSLR